MEKLNLTHLTEALGFKGGLCLKTIHIKSGIFNNMPSVLIIALWKGIFSMCDLWIQA